MNHRLVWGGVLFATMAAAGAAGAELPAGWRAWRYSRPIGNVAVDRQAPVTVIVPWDVFAHCDPHGSDFRIIDERGQEVPYFLAIPQGETTTEKLPSQIIERSFISGKFTQIIVRITDRPALGEGRGVTLKPLAEPWFNTYRLTTPENDFMYWVETAVSDDAHQWRVVDARSPISRFRKQGLEGNQTVRFEGHSNQRYLRIRISDPDSQFPVDGVDVLSRSASEPLRSSIPGAFSPEKPDDQTETGWRGDLGTLNVPISELYFSTGQPEFYRAVRISTSNDGHEWNSPASGEIYRFRQNGKVRESLRVNFPEKFARFWRVEIVNGNDQPLANVRLEFRGFERRITFRGEPSHTYRLAYGNDKAAMPQYDFARVFNQGNSDQGNKLAVFLQPPLGPEERTSNYADPRPFTERHPNLLWLALALAVILLGYAAIRALRTPIPEAR